MNSREILWYDFSKDVKCQKRKVKNQKNYNSYQKIKNREKPKKS